ncbi:LysR family transcriptional regulator [Cupriavidus taiwanensis]|nr:LysR family transcriptional regulator [Cupriavidus taiwanensis]
MNFTLREFRVFRVVYELRSFSGASQTLHMTQSAVSKVCQEMESKVGQRLFERSTRKVVPTLLADQLYRHVCEVLGTMDAAERSMRSLLNHGSRRGERRRFSDALRGAAAQGGHRVPPRLSRHSHRPA